MCDGMNNIETNDPNAVQMHVNHLNMFYGNLFQGKNKKQTKAQQEQQQKPA